jgi:hypothetical protein
LLLNTLLLLAAVVVALVEQLAMAVQVVGALGALVVIVQTLAALLLVMIKGQPLRLQSVPVDHIEVMGADLH